jgi:hypothetical protein
VFEQSSNLVRIDESAFRESGLQAIVIPWSIEMLGSCCFAWFKSLTSITFESTSRLMGTEKSAFRENGLQDIVIPCSV